MTEKPHLTKVKGKALWRCAFTYRPGKGFRESEVFGLSPTHAYAVYLFSKPA